MNKIRKYLGLKDPRSCETRETSGYWSSSSDDLNSARKLSKDHGQTRIAFGTKVTLLLQFCWSILLAVVANSQFHDVYNCINVVDYL